mmetsp:Transcript_76981/g.89484  ORF Transcript_76981/g.89484 Transcript_76981/m.89484 type:complete len:186 (+) Transcript_76981:1128-1685(+)
MRAATKYSQEFGMYRVVTPKSPTRTKRMTVAKAELIDTFAVRCDAEENPVRCLNMTNNITMETGTSEVNAAMPTTARKPMPASGRSFGTSTYLDMSTQNTPKHFIVSLPHTIPILPTLRQKKAKNSDPIPAYRFTPLVIRNEADNATYTSVKPIVGKATNATRPQNVLGVYPHQLFCAYGPGSWK